jgi:hypothetical protein
MSTGQPKKVVRIPLANSNSPLIGPAGGNNGLVDRHLLLTRDIAELPLLFATISKLRFF